MKRVITLVSATIGLLACVAVANAQSSQPNTANPPAGTSNQPILSSPAPWPSVGDTFTFRRGLVRPPIVWTYLGSNGDQHCYSKSQAGTETTTECRTQTDKFRSNAAATSFGEVPMNREGGTVRARLSFPLFVGKTWEYTWKNPHPFLGDYTHDFFATFTTKVEVTAYEPVTVGAGTFDAFKIEATSTQWGESLNPFRAIEYYSPQLGVIKRHSFSSGKEIYSYDIDDELVSYTRAQAGGARR